MHQKFLFPTLLIVGLCGVLTAQTPASDFFDPDVLQTIDLTIEDGDWQRQLDSIRLNGGGYLLATATINGTRYENVGVRYRGSKSYAPGRDRNPLNIKLDFIKKDQNHQGQRTLKLSTALRDPSMVREVLSYEIARNYLPAPRANYARVRVNGRDYGLLVNLEPIDDRFLERHFGTSDGAFYKTGGSDADRAPRGCLNNVFGNLQYDDNIRCYLHNFEQLSDGGWDELIELTRVLDQEPDRIGEVLDVDQTLWMLAFNNVLVNLNSYSGNNSQNFYLYRDSTGRFHPIIWDLNLSFGSYKNASGGSDLGLRQLQQLDPLLHVDNPTKPLISKLLSDENYRRRYLSHVRQIVYDHFKDGQYLERARELQRVAQSAYIADPFKEYSYDEFQRNLTETIGKRSQIPGLEELMDTREDFLRKHELLAVIPPEFEEVMLRERRELSNERIDAFTVRARVGKFPKRVTLMYRFSPDASFQSVRMSDDGKHLDYRADDGVFAATVLPPNANATLEYYLVAENAALSSYEPANYTRERRTATLGELNK